MFLDTLLKPIYYGYERFLEKRVRRGKMPRHVAIIMDGNRRMAHAWGVLPWEGHRMGAEKLREVLDWCTDLGIQTVTAYSFSSENFQRPPEELEHLFDLFEEYFYLAAEDEKIHRMRARVRAIGRVDRFPERVRKAIRTAEERTKDYTDFNLNLAIAYGGRQEVLDAVRKIAEDVRKGKRDLETITEETFSQYLYTNGIPDPDLIIRTSGEERISGFLLWQSAYSELYFCESFWPGFRKIDFLRALRTYQQRERRFGT
jgi:tritrans,polycis-undecaprenyl-diphosphate synthase [geranylgeranyl-diphosphate specific]